MSHSLQHPWAAHTPPAKLKPTIVIPSGAVPRGLRAGSRPECCCAGWRSGQASLRMRGVNCDLLLTRWDGRGKGTSRGSSLYSAHVVSLDTSKGSKGWIRSGRVSASQGSEEVAENQSLQCHWKSSRKPWRRLRRGGNVIPLCALCSPHWEMYDNEPDKLWARAVRKRVELSCQ